MRESLLQIINQVRANKGLPALDHLQAATRLREDAGLDSLDLAELTVRIEAQFGIDVFRQGNVRSIAEIEARLAPSPEKAA